MKTTTKHLLILLIIASAIFSCSDDNGNTVVYSSVKDYAEQNKDQLEYAILDSTDLSGVDLSDGQMVGIFLTDSHLGGSDLSYTNANYAQFQSVYFDGSDLTNGSYIEADFNYAELRGTVLDSADLTRASLQHVSGNGSHFKNATLYSAKLDSSIWDGTEFTNADLRFSSFNAAIIQSNFSGANCAFADFTNTASFSPWQLQDAYSLYNIKLDSAHMEIVLHNFPEKLEVVADSIENKDR